MSRFRTFAPPALVGGALILSLAISGCQTGASPSVQAPSVGLPSAIASALPSGAGKAVVTFKPVGNSNVSGGALINDLGGGQTAIIVGVIAQGFEEPMPGVVYEGDCTTPPTLAPQSPAPSASAAASGEASAAASAPASAETSPGASAAASGSAEASLTVPPGQFKLKDLVAGTSSTTIDVNLTDLLGTPHAIALYRSAADPTVVSCGEIMATPLASPGASAPAAPSEPASAPASVGASPSAGASGAASASTAP